MIKVNTLGTFQITADEKVVSLGNRMSNSLRLFLLLITYADEGLSKNNLNYKLFYSQETDSVSDGNLRVTLHRLRKTLSQSLPGCESDDCIILKNNIYRWNPDIPLWVDADEFERIAQEVIDGDAHDPDLLERGLEVLDLYKGEYLTFLNTEDWVIFRQTRISRLYDELYQKLYQELSQQDDFQRAYDLAARAASLFPFDEYQADMIDCLLSTNSYTKALQVYTDTNELYYREMGLKEPSKRMKQQLQRIRQPLLNSPTNILADNVQDLLAEEEVRGAYYCALPSFIDSCHFVSRFIDRTGQSSYVLIITLEDMNRVPLDPNSEKTKQLSETLLQLLEKCLRKGDIFTTYNPFTFLALLMCTNDAGCEIVQERIEQRFRQQNTFKKVRLSFKNLSISQDNDLPSELNALYGCQEVCVCVDEYQTNEFSGRLYHRFDSAPETFKSLIELFMMLNRLYDRIGIPQSDRQMRPISNKTTLEPLENPVPIYSTEEIMKNRGKVFTCCLKVSLRRNLTWQGTISLAETGKSESFYSELQLSSIIEKFAESGQPGA